MDPTRVEHHRNHRIRGALRRTETDRQRIVIVVNEFDCAGQPLPEASEDSPCQRGHFRREFIDEEIELLLG